MEHTKKTGGMVRFHTNPAHESMPGDNPERELDLDEVRADLAELVAGHTVLELGCGAGSWTAVMADTAERIVALDGNPAMLEQARALGLPEDTVKFRLLEGGELPAELGDFTAVFMGFWWSRIAREEQDAFLKQLRARVGKDALLILLDDDYVEGSSLTVARTDLQGNTFQIVTTPDGQRIELPKTYPTDSTLRKRLGVAGREIRIARWDYVWLATCRLK